jgi:hypothetical protein
VSEAARASGLAYFRLNRNRAPQSNDHWARRKRKSESGKNQYGFIRKAVDFIAVCLGRSNHHRPIGLIFSRRVRFSAWRVQIGVKMSAPAVDTL